MKTKASKPSKKDRRKVIRSIFQVLVLIVVAYLAIVLFYGGGSYKAYDEKEDIVYGDGGFVAISYFGVDYTGGETRISTESLREHLQVLKDSGYVTISQQDVIDYYNSGKKLPEKALFLFFEDGRRDTAVNSQKILEECNFKASMLSYANNLDDRNHQFLTAENLIELENSSFWELGTNGYRLSYINVFDRHENFLGEMTPVDFVKISQYVTREYNHYLMDFVRDKNDIPMENYKQMQERIAEDYYSMKTIYEQELGGLPKLYALMHSNTGQFGTNEKVSAENAIYINQMFEMNFNREMYSYNDKECSVLDLTRMQPQPYWSKNHLLMRIWDDTGAELAFVEGDKSRAAEWELLLGAAEFDGDTIYLTSLPTGEGVVRLKDSNYASDFTLSAYFNGNKLGTQSMDLGVTEDREQYLAIEIKNNNLIIVEKAKDGEGDVLFSLDLDIHDGIEYETWEENRQEALEAEILAKTEQTYLHEESLDIAEELKLAMEDASYVNKEDFIPGMDIKNAGSRYVSITRIGNSVTVLIDNKVAVENLEVNIPLSGDICLRSGWDEYLFSQRNLADDVYDGVFQSLIIHEPISGELEEKNVYFSNGLSEVDYYKSKAAEIWKSVANWFIKNS